MTLKKKNLNLIAIGGLKNSGKDEASRMLRYCLNAPKFLRNYWCYKHFNKIISGKYTITSFAHPLKRTLAALLNIPIEKFENRNFKEHTYIYFPLLQLTTNPELDKVLSDNKFSKAVAAKDFSFLQTHYITIRQLLQCFGTEIMRGYFGDNLWILATIIGQHNLIISDLRFKVEAEAIHNNKGKIIYINRNICIPGNHASEREIVELKENKIFDYIINNNGTLKDLFNNINKIC